MRRALPTLTVLLLLAACGDDGERAAAPAPPPARWYAGDLHVHSSVGSNDTRYPDGSLRSFPETIRDLARERGLSFVVVTDHSNSTGSDVTTTVEDANLWNMGPEFPLWDTAAALSGPDFLLVNGSEISPVSTLDPAQCLNCPTTGTGELTPVGHIGCLPASLAGFERSGAFVDRPPGEVAGGSGIEQCHARGGFAVVNHPYFALAPWLEYDWTRFDYDAVEVWNGTLAFTPFDALSYDAYLCDRLAGRDVVAVGGSDNHRTPVPYADPVGVELGAPLGLPATSVLATRLEWPDLLAGIRAGRIVVHELGSFVEYRVLAASGEEMAGVGDTLARPEGTVTVRLVGRSPRPQQVRLYFVPAGGCEDTRQPGSNAPPLVARQVVTTRAVCPAGACEFDESIALELSAGLYFATLGDFEPAGLSVRNVAVTNVLTVAPPRTGAS